MLEDCTTVMDKKSASRITPQPSCKGNGSEFKKSQDGSGSSKHFPRAPKKRETPGTNPTKYDQSRKPQPQKSKVFDKRPRHRGQFYGGGKEDSKVGDETAEIGSVLGNGSKKVNLNHLLNFHYTPKDGGGANKHTQGRWLSNLKHKYNKEQFLQANCQFVVKATGDYSRYLNDPDRLVDWDLVEQIRVQSSELLSCPICLSSPTAARMTRCGHIYCWPCLLHYLALAEKSYSKCPICYEAVHRDDLKSVVALCHAEHSSGEMVTMRLMRRERGALVTVPVENALHHVGLGSTGPVSLTDNIENTVYSKLLLATTNQVYDILEHEGAELTERLKDEEHTPEICFTEQALELLRQRQSCLNKENSPKPTIPDIVEDEPEIMVAASRPNIVYQSAFDEVEENSNFLLEDRVRYESMSGESVDSAALLSPTSDDLEANFAEALETDDTPSQQVSTRLLPSKYVYFYQASDGQHMYLHPINARMLESTYGSLESSPLELKGRIVEKDSGSMTAELRHRLRHLQHLPVTCQFEVVEIEMRPPVVSPETVRIFRDQLDQRKRKRQKRARDERRREKHIMEEENKKWGRFPSPKIKIESHSQFPECGIDNSPPKILAEPGLSLSQSSLPLAEEFEDMSLEKEASGGPSFAQMLREGKCQRTAQWPAPTRQAAWPGVSRPAPASDGEPDPEGYVPAPSFNQSFGDAFAQALEQAAVSSQETKQDSSTSRKKKKPKQKVLLSTNMAYSSK